MFKFILIQGGNAYRLEPYTLPGGVKQMALVEAPVMADGSIDNNWGAVDYNEVDDKENLFNILKTLFGLQKEHGNE
jgi:hypothetical protein